MGKVARIDLDKCCRSNEYYETVMYASEHKEVKGMNQLLFKLCSEGEAYKKDITAIIESERETEKKKYMLYRKCYITRKICWCLMIGLALLWGFLNLLFDIVNMHSGTDGTLLMFSYLVGIAFFGFLAALIAENISAKNYADYANEIEEKTGNKTTLFLKSVKNYHITADNMYLGSLDPAHREMVLMHREQTAHNKKMLRLENERNKKTKQMLDEQRRTRRAQEELLDIEKERERRYHQ